MNNIKIENDKQKVVNRLIGYKYGRYIFPISLSGYGKNPNEAWENATIGFQEEPGDCPEDYEFEEEDEY